jgi:hypothetical protein
VNAEAVAGMMRIADILTDVGAPQAARYMKEAADYREDLRDAVIRASRQAAVVRLRGNTYVPYVPTCPHQRIRHWGPLRPAYYSRYGKHITPNYDISGPLEVFAGPILLLLSNVFNADEPLTNWVLDDWEDNATMSSSLGINVHGWVDDKYWFSQGGMVFEPGRNPAPVYLRRKEVPAAIRTLYNGFVATYFPSVNSLGEEFHEWGGASSPIKTADEARFIIAYRSLLVREDGDALWLGAGLPRRCLAPGKAIAINGAPTYFGAASLTLKAAESSVEALVELPTRNPLRTAWLVLRLPNEKPIRSVVIDGKPWTDFDAKAEQIRLPIATHPLQISVRF